MNAKASLQRDATYGATANTSAKNPYFSTISQIQSSESANYNGLQVTLQKRLSKGFSAQGFYVWSKALQSLDLDTSGNTGNSTGTEPEDNNLHYLDRQRSDYDQRHVVAASVVWKPHYGFDHRFVRAIVNDWTVTSIIRIQSGLPYNITTGTDTNGDNINNDRPNLAPGVAHASLTDNGHSRSKAMAAARTGSARCNSVPLTGPTRGTVAQTSSRLVRSRVSAQPVTTVPSVRTCLTPLVGAASTRRYSATSTSTSG